MLNGRLRGFIKRIESTLPVRVLLRFAAVDGKSRTVILASQVFTTLIPLLLVIASIGTSPEEHTRLAGNLIHRFRLEGQAATAVQTLFSRPPDATGGLGLLGAFMLLFSLLSLAKSLQNTFATAWGAPPGGLRQTLYGVCGTALLVIEVAVLSLLAATLRGIPGGAATNVFLSLVESVLFWLLLQYVLLSRRISWRRLVPAAALAGAGQVGISVYSATYMPSLIAANSVRYGIIGVCVALITWLLVIAGAVVVCAVAGAEFAGQPPLTLDE